MVLKSANSISIHSPLAGRDIESFKNSNADIGISIHSPLAGRDLWSGASIVRKKLFQSTRPSRGETFSAMRASTLLSNFNPLAPRGARQALASFVFLAWGISIHSPLAGRDFPKPAIIQRKHISIHSPLAGRDTRRFKRRQGLGNFNPLAPRGARRRSMRPFLSAHDFNPLAPRGARQQTVTKYFLQKLFTLHNSYPCKFGNRDYKQENEVCLGKKQAYIWCEPTRNWV